LTPAPYVTGMENMHQEKAITVYYNGSCNICGPEVALYQRLAAESGADVEFMDVSGDCPADMDQTTLLRQFHVRDTDGTLKIGLDGFILLWRRLPRFRMLANVTALPVIRHLGQVVYLHIIAPWLFRRYQKQTGK
ncbi:MAG: thiol-disulfide oxidoreductase DCC family protein, partial [Parvibaculales bacterium]